MILVLQFGSFRICSQVPASRATHVRPIRDAPLSSNVTRPIFGEGPLECPFINSHSKIAFGPVAPHCPMLASSFACPRSGVMHTLVISLAGAHRLRNTNRVGPAAGVASIIQHRVPRIPHGRAGQFFTASVVAVPACWLVHPRSSHRHSSVL